MKSSFSFVSALIKDIDLKRMEYGWKLTVGMKIEFLGLVLIQFVFGGVFCRVVRLKDVPGSGLG
ncbi:MAG: hypothetical protein NTW32_13475 [Chloroflexi bacterium]|nr:hypothetical protein [Chloroflexota bacterium]